MAVIENKYTVTDPSNIQPEPRHRHLGPAIISLFLPGVGQIVKGQTYKGLFILIAGGAVMVFTWFTFIIPILIWAWNVYDAYMN